MQQLADVDLRFITGSRMFFDLDLPYPANAHPAEISRTLALASELGYNCVALSRDLSGKVPTNLSGHAIPLPLPLSISVPKAITLLNRITFTISDPSQNHRLASLQSACNILALRPTNERSFALCCQSLECDLISLDLSIRLPFILKFSTMAAATKRGVRFEICYSTGLMNNAGADSRRNLISGAAALIRATRGRGIIVSSEAKTALGLRGPWDVINLVALWGLNQERGKEAVCEEARKVVQLARLKRESFRGVVEVVSQANGEEKAQNNHHWHQKNAEGSINQQGKDNTSSNTLKRKASTTVTPGSASNNIEQPLTKKQMKKRAKKARSEAAAATAAATADGATSAMASQTELQLP